MSSPQVAQAAFSQAVPSRLADVESLCKRIRGTLRAAGLSAVCFPVELLARESLVNAVIHGNGRAADKLVHLSLSVGRKWICVRVRDEGQGFAWRRASRKTPDPARCTGRGLQLFALYADRVRFNRKGNQIALWIRKTK